MGIFFPLLQLSRLAPVSVFAAAAAAPAAGLPSRLRSQPGSSDLCQQFLSGQRSAALFLRSARLLPTNRRPAPPPGAVSHWPRRASSALRHSRAEPRAGWAGEAGRARAGRLSASAFTSCGAPGDPCLVPCVAPSAPASLPQPLPRSLNPCLAPSVPHPAAAAGSGDRRSSLARARSTRTRVKTSTSPAPWRGSFHPAAANFSFPLLLLERRVNKGKLGVIIAGVPFPFPRLFACSKVERAQLSVICPCNVCSSGKFKVSRACASIFLFPFWNFH